MKKGVRYKEPGKAVNVWLPEEFVAYLEERATADDRTISKFIGMNLKRYFQSEFNHWKYKRKKDGKEQEV